MTTAPLGTATTASDGLLDGWALDLTAVTSLPLSVGMDVQLTAPFGGFVALHGGHTPNAYLAAATEILTSAGVIDDNASPLAHEAIANGAWNFRASVGYALPDGLELSAGYTFVTSASALTPSAIEHATGQSFRWPGMTVVPIRLTMHALHARVGWRFVIEDHLVLRVALGWTHAVAGEASVDVPEAVRDVPSDPAGQFESGIRNGMTSNGFTPELILGAGYRF